MACPCPVNQVFKLRTNDCSSILVCKASTNWFADIGVAPTNMGVFCLSAVIPRHVQNVAFSCHTTMGANTLKHKKKEGRIWVLPSFCFGGLVAEGGAQMQVSLCLESANWREAGSLLLASLQPTPQRGREIGAWDARHPDLLTTSEATGKAAFFDF